MENQLAENIREYRKSLGLTQEQMAERLGITLGTVSKWERGSSEPDLGYIMDLAELFHVSVDALIGFSMRGADADGEADRIEEMVNQVPFEQLEAEYDNALKKFPNHFRIVAGAASLCTRFGMMNQNEAALRRALSLYRHAIGLLSQNKDPNIDEVFLRNEIAGCYSKLKEHQKAVEEYKKNNPSGLNNAKIGQILICDVKKPEEGICYTEGAFTNQLGDMTTVMSSYVRYFMATGDRARGIRAADWAIEYLTRSKEDPEKPAFLDKIISMFTLFRAAIRDADGQEEAARADLHLAVQTARAFDENPIYTMENMLFTDHVPKTAYFYDDLGATAVNGMRAMIREAGELIPASFLQKLEEAIGP